MSHAKDEAVQRKAGRGRAGVRRIVIEQLVPQPTLGLHPQPCSAVLPECGQRCGVRPARQVHKAGQLKAPQHVRKSHEQPSIAVTPLAARVGSRYGVEAVKQQAVAIALSRVVDRQHPSTCYFEQEWLFQDRSGMAQRGGAHKGVVQPGNDRAVATQRRRCPPGAAVVARGRA